ncbi:MAG: glycosyltransferase family 1 protein [Dehalococcoidia bacterium]|nr:MAG: glycosyltransferase family 1 protein [Dehalococcoidia bacterium]
MKLVTTAGRGSMDYYAAQLAAHLPDVDLFETDESQRIERQFNRSFWSPETVRSLRVDVGFVRRLRRLEGPLHFPNHHLARYGNFLSVPYVVTVHDLIRYFDLQRRQPFIHRPNLVDRAYLRLDYAGIRRADAIIAVSNTTKADVVECLGVPESRVHVVYEGVDQQRFHPSHARPFDFPYVLFVGSEHPRKNLGELIEAFALLKRSGHHPDLRLVKVGAAGGTESDFRATTASLIARHGLGPEVVMVDRVHEDALPAYYAGAECTVLPSLYEGFGFPAVEAMACGSPVVVSSAGSLPEVVGDAGVVVSPRVPEQLAQAIHTLLVDPQRRAQLREAGLRRAAMFTWEQAAAGTRRVYATLEDGVPAIPTAVPSGAGDLTEEKRVTPTAIGSRTRMGISLVAPQRR